MVGQGVDVGSLGSHFESLTDPRHMRNRKHLLLEIVENPPSDRSREY